MRKSRKNEIFDTAMALFAQRGYDAVSVLDICEACGITKKAFYYHYASKEELAAQYFQVVAEAFDWESLRREEERPGADYPELLWRYEAYIVDSGMKLGTDMHDIAHRYDASHGLNLYSPFADGPHKNPTNLDEYTAMVARGQQAGQIRDDRPAQDLLMILFAAVIGLSAHWRAAKRSYDLKAQVRMVFDFVMLPQKHV